MGRPRHVDLEHRPHSVGGSRRAGLEVAGTVRRHEEVLVIVVAGDDLQDLVAMNADGREVTTGGSSHAEVAKPGNHRELRGIAAGARRARDGSARS